MPNKQNFCFLYNNQKYIYLKICKKICCLKLFNIKYFYFFFLENKISIKIEFMFNSASLED